METKRLFYEDPYLAECSAQVIRVEIFDEQSIGIVLDRTCFFPRGGGACGDIGKFNDVDVGETFFDRQTAMILHPIPATNQSKIQMRASISCKIDWQRRYQTMRLHSASHIMEHYLFALVSDLKLVGTNVNADRDSSTYIGGDITQDVLQELNSLVNSFIRQENPIDCYPDPVNPDRRLWKCAGVIIPCGGVHPRNTSEIGPINIRKTRGGKKQEIRTELGSSSGV